MKIIKLMNFLQRCIQPADCSRVDETQDEQLARQLAHSMTQDLTGDFVKIRRQVEHRVKDMLSENLIEEDHLSSFAEIIKMISLCDDFGEGHIMFLDTLWSRSREIIHARRRSEQHLSSDAQTIRLDLETEALYQEMRRDLMDLVRERATRNLLQKTNISTSHCQHTNDTTFGTRTELSCDLNLDAT